MFTADQTILVTGASSGLGRACAKKLNSLGASVVASGRDMEKLQSLRAECQSPANCHLAPRDLVRDMDGLPQWLNDLRLEHGKFWGLCHCAGAGRLDSIRSVTAGEARSHFDINFLAPLMLARGFCDRRNFVSGGAMLFVTSIAGVQPEKGHCLYGAAKAALATAIKAISQEVAPLGLRAHCIAPGLVQTPMVEQGAKAMGGTWLDGQAQNYPLGLGTPDDVAEMAAFLLSDRARWITGQNFVLAGGRI